MARMISPVQGRVTSEYGMRAGLKHGGIDIATGGVQAPVYASFAGRVSHVVSGRAHWQPATIGPVIAPGRSGDGCRVLNPDGETQVYNHMSPLVVAGQQVAAGQLLGHVNLSGITSGLHLHFETWSAAAVTRNPRLYYAHHGLAVGSAPVLPDPDPDPTPTPPVVVADPVVLAWQQRANRHGGARLLEDGIKGPKSLAWEAWVRTLQAALNRWKACAPKLRVDGDYGAATSNALWQVQKANRGVFGAADRVVGPRTIRALGIPARPDVSR